MANRRMFSKTVVCSDSFIELPLSAQALYFQLCMEADDDGFMRCYKKVQRILTATDVDLQVLIDNGFVLKFKTGVIAIAHWNINNQIRKDRHTPTAYQTEYEDVLLDEDGIYKEAPYSKLICGGNQMATKWQPLVAVDKYSTDKYSTDKVSIYTEKVEESNIGGTGGKEREEGRTEIGNGLTDFEETTDDLPF